MPTVARTFSIKYGSTTVGGSAVYELHVPFLVRTSYGRLLIEFRAIVSEATNAAFTSAVEALEAAFRVPRQDVVVDWGATARTWSETYNAANSLAFNISPSIEMVSGSPRNTGQSREYLCRIEAELPADLSGENGLADLQVSVTTADTELRTITISGEYTQVDADLARAQYESQIAALTTTVQNAVDSGASWHVISDTVPTDTKDKHASFARVIIENYTTILATQALDAAAGILNPIIGIQTSRPSPGDFIVETGDSVRRPVQVTVGFQCSVKRSVASGESGLRALFFDTVLPALETKAKDAVTTPGAAAMFDPNPTFDVSGNKITATVVFLMLGAAKFLELDKIVRYGGNKGVRAVPAHGKRTDKYLMKTSADIVCEWLYQGVLYGGLADFLSWVEFEEGEKPDDQFLGGGGDIDDALLDPNDVPVSGAEGGTWVELIHPEPSYDVERMGDIPYQVTVVRFAWRRQFMYVTEPDG